MASPGFRLRRRLLYNRLPLVGGWLSRWAARGLALSPEPAAVNLLAVALVADDTSPRVRNAARLALERIDPPQLAVNLICLRWAATRHVELEQLIVRRRWIAGGPPDVRLLSALKAGRGELVQT